MAAGAVSSVSLALGNGTPNQLNIVGSLITSGGASISGRKCVVASGADEQ